MSDIVTAEDIAQAICKNAKTQKWLSCTFKLKHDAAIGGYVSVGVKSFGLWVQVIECAGLRDGIPEQKTQKALKAAVIDILNYIVGTIK